jgi:hypothetical protein
MFSRFILTVNNFVMRFRTRRYPAANVVIIAPRCIHMSQCKLNVEDDINECMLCGRCNVKELVELSRRCGLQCVVSRGGREAVAFAKDPSVKGVIAVACVKELAMGILAVFPKPVIAVSNCQPNGACKDTCVNMAELQRAVSRMVAEK